MKRKIVALLALVLTVCSWAGMGWAEPLRKIDVQALKGKLDQSPKAVVVDVGGLLSCLDAKIPGAVCRPCDGKDASSFPADLPKDSIIVFYTAGKTPDGECGVIQQTLAAGFREVYVLEGGLAAWRKAGYPAAAEKRIPRITAHAVPPSRVGEWQKTQKNSLIIDIRSPKAFAAGHLDGAVNYPLAGLHLQYADIPLDRSLLVVDEDGAQSFLAASYLVRKGFVNVKRLRGGMADYRRRVP